jgi:hypothetical protein
VKNIDDGIKIGVGGVVMNDKKKAIDENPK